MPIWGFGMARKKKETPVTYGGQAVMEGVMMRGKEHYCLAVRNPAGQIETRHGQLSPSNFSKKADKIPILRGVVKMGFAAIVGYKVMNTAADLAGLDEPVENPSKFDLWLEKKFGDKLGNYIMILAVILSLGFSVALFMVLPTWLSGFLLPLLGDNLWALGIIEGLVRLAIFIGYLILMSQIKVIKRVFQYHGAEHKVINCHEANQELTPEAAAPHKRVHKRCGTSFLLFIMLISMIFFLFVRTDVVWLRVASRILFVPFIAGISFEVIRWAGVSKSLFVKILSWPGFMMQRITTAEPDRGQLEVAIAALNGVIFAEQEAGKTATLAELRTWGREKIDSEQDVDALLVYAIPGLELNDILTKGEQAISFESRLKFKDSVEKRAGGMPLQYVVGSWEFMSLNFNITQDVLIPRGDTEILVQTILDKEGLEKKGLEIGLGSGCISVALAHHGKMDMTGAEICHKALAIAIKNYKDILGGEPKFVKSDLFESVPRGTFDFIVSNPPYIPSAELASLDKSVTDYEPKGALDGGADGLDFYKKIGQKAPEYLVAGGRIYFEIGHNQGEDVKSILMDNGFSDIEIIKDLANHDRIVSGELRVES